LYRVHRRRQGDVVLVWVSDAYLFTDMDYHNRPDELGPGDYVLVAKPEGGAQVSAELIAEARIGVGQVAELMGALTVRDTWKYVDRVGKRVSGRKRGGKPGAGADKN